MEPQQQSPINTTTPIVTPTPAKPTSKMPWLILVLILLLVVGIGGVFLGKQMIKPAVVVPTPSPIAATSTPYPTPDETANWQVYTHPQNLYSFKYGPGFVLTDYSEGNHKGVAARFLGPTQVASGRTETSLSDGVIAKTLVLTNSTLSVDKSIEELHKVDSTAAPGDFTPDVSPISKTTVDGKVAYWYTVGGFTDAKVIQVALNSTTILQIVGLYTSPEYLAKFDQILSTFKFTNMPDSVVLVKPTANTVVTSPLNVSGAVPSGWMFEGQLPIKLLDSKRNLIIQSIGKEVTPGSWQSGNPVQFSGTLTFITNDSTGFLVIENDNPSGLPENSKSYELPVRFK